MFRKAITIPKSRLATQLTAFAVFAVLIAMITSYLVVARSEQAFVYRKAEARANTLAPALAGGLDVIEGVAWVIPPRDPAAGPPPLPRVAALPVGHNVIEIDGVGVHFVVRDFGDGRRSIVRYSEGPHREQLAGLGRLLAGLGLVLVAATVVLAPWWAGFMLRNDPVVRRRVGQQMKDAARIALRSKEETASTLARTYTEYVRLLYEPDERSREFIANVGHELRTPVTLVRSGCEVLATNPDLKDRDQRRIARMIAALDHMTETIRSFMILARGGDYGPSARVRVRDVLEEVVALNQVEAQEKGIGLVIEVGGEDAEDLNREALTIAVANLVRNAIRHGDGSEQIVLRCGNREVSVSDRGPGIPTDDRAHIFLPFYRARRAAESGTFGLGLGLAIVKRVCDACGWRIDVISREGHGTTFTIQLG